MDKSHWCLQPMWIPLCQLSWSCHHYHLQEGLQTKHQSSPPNKNKNITNANMCATVQQHTQLISQMSDKMDTILDTIKMLLGSGNSTKQTPSSQQQLQQQQTEHIEPIIQIITHSPTDISIESVRNQ